MLHLKSNTQRIFCNTSINATWCRIENRVLGVFCVCACVCVTAHCSSICLNLFAYVLRWRPGAKGAWTRHHTRRDSRARGGELRWSGVRLHPGPALRPWHPGEHSSVKVQGSVKSATRLIRDLASYSSNTPFDLFALRCYDGRKPETSSCNNGINKGKLLFCFTWDLWCVYCQLA